MLPCLWLSLEEDAAAKEFKAPSEGMAGVYIYRNSSIGQMIKKDLFIDDELIGTSINKVYFYAEVTPGSHTISTESEFSNNSVEFIAEAGKHYFFRQYMKFGVFIGGAGIEQVPDDEGIKNVQKTSLRKSMNN